MLFSWEQIARQASDGLKIKESTRVKDLCDSKSIIPIESQNMSELPKKKGGEALDCPSTISVPSKYQNVDRQVLLVDVSNCLYAFFIVEG